MAMRDIMGIAVAVIVLAGISVAIVNGEQTASIIGHIGDSFSTVVKAATLQGHA